MLFKNTLINELINGNFILKCGHKCQITNFILNLKIKFLKFRIFSFHIQKKNYNYCLSLKFIFFICLKNKKNIFLNYNRCKLLTFTKKNKKAFEQVCERVLRGMCACSCVYIYIYIY